MTQETSAIGVPSVTLVRHSGYPQVMARLHGGQDTNDPARRGLPRPTIGVYRRRMATVVRTLPVWAGPVLSALVILNTLSRGMQYTFDPPVQEWLVGVSVIGVHAWGIIFLALAAVLSVGLVMRLAFDWLHPLALGHSVGAGIWTCYTVALFQGVHHSAGTFWVNLTTAVTGAVLNLVLGISMSRRARARAAGLSVTVVEDP